MFSQDLDNFCLEAVPSSYCRALSVSYENKIDNFEGDQVFLLIP